MKGHPVNGRVPLRHDRKVSDLGRTLLPMRSARTIPLLVFAALVVTLGGCSGSPSPRVWAANVCTALSPWRTEIGTLTTRTQQQMTAETTPAQAKENLMRLFAGAEEASDKARAGVEKAGVPDVEQGKQIADSFMSSLSAMGDAYGRAESGIAALAVSPTKDFYTQVAAVVATLQTEYSKSELDTSKLDSKELSQAFDEVPACR
jgi:hypothetical protein